MKRMLMVNGSPRRNGSCTRICDAISELAGRFGYGSDMVFLDDLDIRGCKACMGCKSDGRCVQGDPMNEMIDRIRGSDMLVLLSPVYFGAESAQLKTFTDRLYPLFIKRGAVPDVGRLCKASVVMTCGDADGNMTYGGIISRYTRMFKSMGIIDVSGCVIPDASPDTVMDKDSVKDLLDSIEFQLEM